MYSICYTDSLCVVDTQHTEVWQRPSVVSHLLTHARPVCRSWFREVSKHRRRDWRASPSRTCYVSIYSLYRCVKCGDCASVVFLPLSGCSRKAVATTGEAKPYTSAFSCFSRGPRRWADKKHNKLACYWRFVLNRVKPGRRAKSTVIMIIGSPSLIGKMAQAKLRVCVPNVMFF